MPDTHPPSSQRGLTLIATTALCLLCVWFLTQNGLAPQAPEAFTWMTSRTVHALPWLGLLWLAAAGYGRIASRRLLGPENDHLTTRLTLGMAVLLIAFWISAWLVGWLVGSAWILCLTGLVLFVLGLVKDRPKQRLRTGRPFPWTWLWLAPPIAMLLTAACCPPGTLWRVEAFAYDATSYHLELPREWLARGWMAGLSHNVYSFLPDLIETGYLLIASLKGPVENAVFTCQLCHASLALLAAATLGKWFTQRLKKPTGPVVATLFLSVPWILITGSLAYDEMGMMAFGVGAICVAFSAPGRTRRGAAAVGLLLGTATLSKLTAGLMFAVPVGLVLLLGLNTPSPQSTSPGGGDDVTRRTFLYNLQRALIAALIGVLMLSPYLIRNATQTGNPVFPFAAEQLGRGHWSDQLVQRWNKGHTAAQNHEGRLESLSRQWLLNTGYGAIGGAPAPRETQNIARFNREGGVPILWLAVTAASVLVITDKRTRRTGAALLIILALQLIFWLFFTHLQSRFLLPTLVPATLLCGLGYERLHDLTRNKAPSIAPLFGSAVLVCMVTLSYTTLLTQTPSVTDQATGRRMNRPLADALLTSIANPDHPINRLPENSKTLIVADDSSLLYLQRPFIYASAFDESPLGRYIRQADHDPQKVNQLLRQAGVTHVWVGWSELSRLHNTYGHDPDVTARSLQRLIATGWRPVESDNHNYTLFALPQKQ